MSDLVPVALGHADSKALKVVLQPRLVDIQGTTKCLLCNKKSVSVCLHEDVKSFGKQQ